MARFLVLTFASLTAVLTLSAQPAVDSLKRLLQETNNNKQRVDILNQLAFELYDINANEGFKAALEANELSASMRYESGQKKALALVGYRYTVSGEFRKAIDYYRQVRQVNSTVDDQVGYSEVMEGNAFRSLAKYDSAQILFTQSIQTLTQNPNPFYLAFAYKSLARLYLIQWRNRDAETYFKKALAIYEQEKNTRGLADVWFALSDVNRNLADYPMANDYLESGCDVASRGQNDYLKLLCFKNQGDFFIHRGEFVKALEVLFKALDILKSRELPQLLASVYGQLGEVYEELGQHDIALKYYFDALKITEPLGVKYEIGHIYSEVGWIYKNQLNFTLAKSYMDKSLALRQEIMDEHGISNSFNVLGVLYYQQKKYDEALASLEKSLAIRERIGHQEGVSACLFNIAVVYEDLGQLNRALEYHARALKIDERIANKQGLSISYNQIGKVYTKLHNFPEAKRYLAMALSLSEQTNAKMSIMSNQLSFSALYEAQGEYKKALHYHQLYSQLRDSIYSESSALKLAEMQALYQVEQKNQEIALLNQNKEIQTNQIQFQRSQIGQQRTIIISGLVGLLLIAAFAAKTYQYTARIRRANREILEQKEEIQVQSEELIEANRTIALINKDLESKIEDRTSALRQAYKELDTFFYRSSHDFRRPLTTFLGLAEVAKITIKDSYALELFSKVKETASNLDKMLTKLQSISDVGVQQLVFKDVYLKEIFKNILDSFSDVLKQKNIRTSLSVELTAPFFSYPAMVKIIAENLVENAIFFSGVKDPFINIRVHDSNKDHTVVIEVEDNGQGIESQYQELIFEMYFRANDRSKGNGLGLYIVKKAVEKLHGEITFSTSFGKGSTFRVALPGTVNPGEV